MYDINLGYRKGKLMQFSDTLSRAYIPEESSKAIDAEFESVDMTQYLTISAARLEDIHAHTASDESLHP